MRLAHVLATIMALVPAPAALSADSEVRINAAYSKNFYGIRVLDGRSFVYSDRDYVFGAIPTCLDRQPYLVTPNQDKFSSDARLVELSASQPVTVYVGHDNRYRAWPDWLRQNYERTTMTLGVEDPRNGQTILTFDLYRTRQPARDITLGGNIPRSERSNFAMYTAIFVPANQDRCPR